MIQLNSRPKPLNFGLDHEAFQTVTKPVTEILNILSAKSVAGLPRIFGGLL